MYDAITDVPGIKVGHFTNPEAITGCTVILCENGAIGGVDVRGSAPGTRETDLLRPTNLVESIHAILLSGGSAYGLDAAGGVMRYLEENNYGHDTLVAKVPIVPSAVIFDLNIGNHKIRPGIQEGYQACLTANDKAVAEGSVGAGTGATVGKILGINNAVKSGLGTYSCQVAGDIVVAALVVANAVGDVVDFRTGKIIAGPRDEQKKSFSNTVDILRQTAEWQPWPSGNTTLAVVATNAHLTKEQTNKLSQMAQDGLSRAINPCHTMHDGDAVFALSIGDKKCDINILGPVAAEVVSLAIMRAVQTADTLGGIPSIKDWPI
jgi:L-aminopeptidase/D-esterase-like protein